MKNKKNTFTFQEIEQYLIDSNYKYFDKEEMSCEDFFTLNTGNVEIIYRLKYKFHYKDLILNIELNHNDIINFYKTEELYEHCE